MSLAEALPAWIDDPSLPINNLMMGKAYQDIGNNAAAFTHYMLAADKATDTDVIYEALLHCGLCMDRMGDRPEATKHLFLRAVAENPQRGEAHWLLSRFYETGRYWHDSYAFASMGATASEFGTLIIDIGYGGSALCLFQKGVAAWWMGRCEESREIMYSLLHDYPLLDPHHRAVVIRNIDSIGYPASAMRHTQKMKVARPFPGVETIETNYSQVYQDMFVLAATNGKKNGRYLEIGHAQPFYNNNTALLEEWGWTGISYDIVPHLVSHFNFHRKNPALVADATTINWGFIKGAVFDYLQVDCEPADISLKALMNIPFDDVAFATITFEHDYYTNPASGVREKSREFLESKGYVLAVNDITHKYDNDKSFEDWWVHPSLVSAETIARITRLTDGPQSAKDWLYT